MCFKFDAFGFMHDLHLQFVVFGVQTVASFAIVSVPQILHGNSLAA